MYIYNYSFNGKETDDESGTQDYGMRIYNPSIARFLSVDPLTGKYPELTPFQFASNSPIVGFDLDGLEFTHNLNREDVQNRVNFLKANPVKIYQGGAGTCAIAAVTCLWIKKDREGFAKAVMKLYDEGKVKVNSYQIAPDNDLFDKPIINNSKYYRGEAEKYQADWMILSSIQDSQNDFFDFEGSDNDWAAGNFTSDAIYLMKNLVGYKNVTSSDFSDKSGLDIFHELMDKSNQGAGILLNIDAHIINSQYDEGSWHSVSVIPGSFSSYTNDKGELQLSFKVQSWGKEVLIEGNSSEMGKYLTDAVYGSD